MPTSPTALVWFRRDLRVFDHAALGAALASGAKIACLFVFDTDILEPLKTQSAQADRRVEFIHRSVLELDASLREHGGRLYVRHGRAEDEVPALAERLEAMAVYANHDYEPLAMARDARVKAALEASGRRFLTTKDQVIFEKDEILTAQGQFYSVFTPYKRAWLKTLGPPDLAERGCPLSPAAFAPGAAALERPIPSLADLGFRTTNLAELGIGSGSSGAKRLLEDFLGRIDAYREQRDYPAVKGPSYLSVHLRFGTVSVRSLVRAAQARLAEGPNPGAETWLSELIWRDFYAQILYHRPDATHRSFKPEYDAIRWEEGPLAEAHFAAWCAGATGYPLVDAAMRQINQSGYMHNRLRMVAASFLIKHLGIDWRRGEAYFAQHLNDFDLTSNNGGWQWAASSGCDAQPYFRIFNPVTQSEKFDAQGRFIRRYLPELSRLPPAFVHRPWTMDALAEQEWGCVLGQDYPRPIVDHAAARLLTLERYQVVKKPGGERT